MWREQSKLKTEMDLFVDQRKDFEKEKQQFMEAVCRLDREVQIFFYKLEMSCRLYQNLANIIRNCYSYALLLPLGFVVIMMTHWNLTEAGI